MADIFWPDTLPTGLLADGFSKQPQSNVIRTAMDAGPKKTRRRYTARTVKYSGRQVFSLDELEIFEQFYHTALADGVLRFNFNDPVTGETAEFRFTEEYTVNEIEGYYDVALSLERL
jgi:hypothetical protein